MMRHRLDIGFYRFIFYLFIFLSQMGAGTSRSVTALSTRRRVFVLTFVSYALFHANRKSFSAIKGQMGDEQWLHSNVYANDQQVAMFGFLDTIFMGFYALGLFLSGMLGDTYNLRYIIATGMGATALVGFAFGLGAVANVHALSFYAVLWGLNGLFQSTGWPANVAVMGKWFDQTERGAVLGIWSGNACVGNITGTGLVALMFVLLEQTIAWKIALIVAAALAALHGCLVFVLLDPDPQDGPYRHELLEKASPETVDMVDDDLEDEMDVEKNRKTTGIGFLEAWRIPGVRGAVQRVGGR